MSREIIMLTVSVGGFFIMANLNAYYDRLDEEEANRQEEVAENTNGEDDTDETDGPETKKD